MVVLIEKTYKVIEVYFKWSDVSNKTSSAYFKYIIITIKLIHLLNLLTYLYLYR